VRQAAIGGMTAIEKAQLAERKSPNAQVKPFAQRMVADVSANSRQVMQVAWHHRSAG